jgi:hypothetical protein
MHVGEDDVHARFVTVQRVHVPTGPTAAEAVDGRRTRTELRVLE